MNRLTVTGGLLVGLVVGAFAAAAVGAQEDTPTPSSVAGAATGGVFGDFKSKLAENLGISDGELDTAIDQTQVDIIDEKLAAGDITQERADALKERIANGEDVPFPFFGDGPRLHLGEPGVGLVESAASVLGMDVADLITELRADKSMNDVAAEKGLSAEDFKAQVLADVKTRLDEKVASGDITQEMADNVYTRLTENVDDLLNNNTFEGRLPFGPHGPGFRSHSEDAEPETGTEDITESSITF